MYGSQQGNTIYTQICLVHRVLSLNEPRSGLRAEVSQINEVAVNFTRVAKECGRRISPQFGPKIFNEFVRILRSVYMINASKVKYSNCIDKYIFNMCYLYQNYNNVLIVVNYLGVSDRSETFSVRLVFCEWTDWSHRRSTNAALGESTPLFLRTNICHLESSQYGIQADKYNIKLTKHVRSLIVEGGVSNGRTTNKLVEHFKTTK